MVVDSAFNLLLLRLRERTEHITDAAASVGESVPMVDGFLKRCGRQAGLQVRDDIWSASSDSSRTFAPWQ